MQEQTDHIRQNQVKLIEMQQKKISKLKRILDVSSETPPLLAKNKSDPKDGKLLGQGERDLKPRNSALMRRQGSMLNRDSMEMNTGMTRWHPASISKTGSKSPTAVPEPSVMRRSIESQSAGRLSIEYKEFVNRRES